MTVQKSNSSSDATGFFSRTSTEFQGSYSSDPDFRERLGLWASLISELAPGRSKALDLGCGPGLLTLELLRSNLSVTAVDGSAEMVALCEKNTSASRAQAECVHDYLPELGKLATQKFDLLLCSSVLEYVPELDSSLRRIADLLAPNGIAIISMPNRQSIYRKIETFKFKVTGRPEYRAYVRHMLTPDELAERAVNAGMEHKGTFFYGEGNGTAAWIASVFPPPLKKNLFVCVLRKSLA